MKNDDKEIPWNRIKKDIKSTLNKVSEESVSSLKDNIELASEKVKSVNSLDKGLASKELARQEIYILSQKISKGDNTYEK